MSASVRARHRLMVSVSRAHRWAAWLEDERVVEFHRQCEADASPIGTIYLGRITHVDKGLGAAFVDVGAEESAFLPLDERLPAIEGAKIVVQIEREGRSGKGPRVTTKVRLPGFHLILLPGRRGNSISQRAADENERSRLAAMAETLAKTDEGFVLRAAAVEASEQQLLEEAASLRTTWKNLLDQHRTGSPPAVLFSEPPIDLRLLRDHGRKFDEVVYDNRNAAAAAKAWLLPAQVPLAERVDFRRIGEWVPGPAEILEQVEDALQIRVDLPTGGGLVIEPTEAMTVIDVNARAVSNGADLASERVLLRTNLEAADEIARQLRLRNIGGIVVVDFIDLKEGAHRRQVVDRLRSASAADSAPFWVGAMSRLGLVELTRKRRGPTLAEAMRRPCMTSNRTGHPDPSTTEA